MQPFKIFETFKNRMHISSSSPKFLSIVVTPSTNQAINKRVHWRNSSTEVAAVLVAYT
jgi:hypothetical protein